MGFLILCSDGLIVEPADPNDYGKEVPGEVEKRWVEIVGEAVERGGQEDNLALALLRGVLAAGPSSGEEEGEKEKVSRALTVEMMERWMDDTTVVVIKF